MQLKNATGRAVLALILAAACWGGATVLTKSILTTVPPVRLLVLQLAASVLLLWLLLALRGESRSIADKFWQVALLGVLNPGISYTLSLIGLTTTAVSISTLLWATEPVLILALAWLLLGERLNTRLALFSTVALSGVLLIGGATFTGATGGDSYGSGLILLGVLCCAFYTVFARKLGATVDPLLAVALQQSVALLWAVLILPLDGSGNPITALRTMPVTLWLAVALSGILYYGLAFWFYLYGLVRVRAGVAGACLNLIPLFGVSGGLLFLQERLTTLQWLGAAAILLAVFAILAGQEKRVDA